jgi:glycosyltransferase involved in cell wall biosynthesis
MIGSNVIKIANVIEDARLAGPQIRIAEVANRLNKYKYQTTVLIPKMDNKRFKKKLVNYGIKFKELPIHRLTKEKKHFLLFVFCFFYEVIVLWRYLKIEQFDLVHASGGSWQWKGVIAGKLAGCKVLWHLNDTKMPAYIKFIFKPLARYFTDGFIVAGNRVKDYYICDLAIKKEIVEVIQAPVDCSSFNPDIVQADSKLENYKGIKIVTVANLNPIKGLETFIKSAAKVGGNTSRIDYFIVGPVYESQKNYSNTLKQIVIDNGLENVHFYGGVDDVKRILKSADIYVCSSLAEASPISIWEAMAMGKPIVSTDVGDAPRFVRNEENGFVVDVMDVDAMGEGIARLINSPELRAKFGSKSREIAVHELDLSQCVTHHENVYQYLMEMA